MQTLLSCDSFCLLLKDFFNPQELILTIAHLKKIFKWQKKLTDKSTEIYLMQIWKKGKISFAENSDA